MRILVVANKPLITLSDGYDLRVWYLCQELAKRHELHLLTVPVNVGTEEMAADGTMVMDEVFSRVTHMPAVPSIRPAPRRHFRRRESDYYPLAFPSYFEHVRQAIDDTCSRFEIKHLMVFNVDLAGFVQPFAKTKKILFDVCDSEVLTQTRELESRPVRPLRSYLKARLMLARWAATEACLPHWFSHVTTINAADTATVCRLAGKTDNVSTVPNGVAPLLEKHCQLNGEGAKRRGVAFWGNLSFEPNRDAVRYFFDSVYQPYLAPAGIEWCVIGRDAEPWLQEAASRDPGIRLPGFVKDMYALASEYPVMVNPMRIGSGMKNKVLEAFALGLTVVSTSLGIEAVEQARCGVDYLIADEPQKMADAIKALIDDHDLRASMVSSARRTVLEHYTWGKVAGAWDELLCAL